MSVTAIDLFIDRASIINKLHLEVCSHFSIGIEKAVKIGQLLTEQKAEFKHGDWIPWVQENLTFEVRQTQKYMKIYREQESLELNASCSSHLGINTAIKVINENKRELIREDTEKPDFVTGKYKVIYADPPWKYESDYLKAHVSLHYGAMTLSEICALPVEEITEKDSVLFLWATSPFLQDAFQVVEAWGFKYKTSMVWNKVKHNWGYYFSARHEFLLVCTKGSCSPEVKKPMVNSVQTIDRTAHSVKPQKFREIIDFLYPTGKRIELFARGKTPESWDNWGAET